MHIEGVLFDLGRRSDRRIIAKLERPCGTEVEIAGITEDEMMTLSSNMFERKKQAILNLFEDDPVAHIMVDGIMEGMEGEELRAFTELDKTAFASKRRLIKRRIEKAFPEGRMP